MSVLLDYFLCVRDGKLLIVKVHLTFGGQRSIIHFYQLFTLLGKNIEMVYWGCEISEFNDLSFNYLANNWLPL